MGIGDVLFDDEFIDNNQIEIPNFENTLGYIYVNFNSEILTSNGISIAIGKHNDQFWMFDSHSRGNHGRPCCDGRACTMSLDYTIIDIINNLHYPRE